MRTAAAGRFATVAIIGVVVVVVLAGGLVANMALQTSSETTASTSGSLPQPAETSSSSSFATTTTSTATPQTSSTSSSLETSLTTSSTSVMLSSSTSVETTSSTTTTSSSATSSSTSSASTSTSHTTKAGYVEVLLPYDVGDNISLNFQPADIKVVVGVNNTIIWNDTDFTQHNIESKSVPAGAKSWNSETLNQGQTYRITLTVAGNYTYYCEIHPWMLGTIEVLP